MFMDFLGLEVNCFEATVKMVSRDRMKDAIVRFTHNHLRLRRILACLSVTGFRLLALWLINILRYYISTEK